MENETTPFAPENRVAVEETSDAYRLVGVVARQAVLSSTRAGLTAEEFQLWVRTVAAECDRLEHALRGTDNE